MKPIRVAIPIFGNHLGGHQISLLLIAEALLQAGVEIKFVLHCADSGLGNFLKLRGHVPSFIEASDFATRNLKSKEISKQIHAPVSTSVSDYLKKHRIDLVHTTCERTNLLWGRRCKKAGVPYIWHTHEKLNDNTDLQRAVCNADSIFVANKFIRQTIPKSYQKKVIELPVPVSMERPDETRVDKIQSQFRGDNPNYLVGVFSKINDQFLELDRMCDIIRNTAMIDRKKVKFIVGGEYSDKEKEKISNLCFDVRDNLAFSGFVYPIVDWLAAMDAVICPSSKHPIGRLSIEAKLAKTPIIAMSKLENRAVVSQGTNGFLSKRHKSEDLAYALRYGLKSEMKTRMQKQVLEQKNGLPAHDPVKVAEQVKEIYKKLMDRKAEKKENLWI